MSIHIPEKLQGPYTAMLIEYKSHCGVEATISGKANKEESSVTTEEGEGRVKAVIDGISEDAFVMIYAVVATSKYGRKRMSKERFLSLFSFRPPVKACLAVRASLSDRLKIHFPNMYPPHYLEELFDRYAKGENDFEVFDRVAKLTFSSQKLADYLTYFHLMFLDDYEEIMKNM